MNLNDLNKDLRRILLANWTESEIVERLSNPEYFFEQVVQPRFRYLREQGEPIPELRLHRTPSGDYRVFFAH